MTAEPASNIYKGKKQKKFEIEGRETSIYRSEHDEENPYVMINRKTLEDTRLSFKARGLLAYMLARPQGWEFNITHLVTQSDKDGRDAIRSALSELVELGYAKRVAERQQGKFTKISLVIYETPRKDEKQEEMDKEFDASDLWN